MKGDDKYKPFPLVSLILAVILIALTVNLAFAQGECNGHSCNKDGSPVDVTNTLNAEGSALTTGGNDYLGLGFGGSSVRPAIGDCIFTEYDSYFIFWDKQRGKENKHCLAMQEHLIGNHNTEARIKCRDTSIGGLYDTFDQCVISQQEHTKKPEGSSGPLDAVVEEIDQHQVVAQQQYEAAQIQMTELMEQVATLQERPKVAYRKAKEPEPFLTDAKRAALLAVKEE